ncbi:MAG: hypothetical protein KatS3mg109_1331 [Pirellulaceae bacterium]|nr:MAG: hypothetical protein KatS3mg109_0401 [Pirellulaceae bacterium]GIW90899.1 MAG: hypothetical protein KatS3mg109_1331 [Pirellulaceae bacterium]
MKRLVLLCCAFGVVIAALALVLPTKYSGI